MRWIIVFVAILAGCVGEICQESTDDLNDWVLVVEVGGVPHTVEQHAGKVRTAGDCSKEIRLDGFDRRSEDDVSVILWLSSDVERHVLCER